MQVLMQVLAQLSFKVVKVPVTIPNPAPVPLPIPVLTNETKIIEIPVNAPTETKRIEIL